MNWVLDFKLYVPVVSCHCHDANSSTEGTRAESSALSFLPNQVWPEAFWLLLSSGAAWFAVIQHKLLKYFADYPKGGKNTLELLQVICRNKNNIHKSWALG